MARDDFNKSTVDILAKRVAYTCSNPTYKAQTVGPHSEIDKPIGTGIAAHIAAAAPGGPRYDATMTALDRASITNGIHLCTTCATIIDRDPAIYTTEVLHNWKGQAEAEALQKLGRPVQTQPVSVPFLEPDLVWQSGGRWHRGYSQQNEAKAKLGPLTINEVVVHWQLNWNYQLAIYNNSGKMAKNIRIQQITDGKPIQIPTLNRVNNLPPFDHLDLTGKYVEWIEGTGAEADAVLLRRIPESLEGMKILINYQDEFGTDYQTITAIADGELVTTLQQ